MNFSQKMGLFVLIIISVAYVYFAFFSNYEFNFPRQGQVSELEPLPEIIGEEIAVEETEIDDKENKTVKIFILDSKGKIRPVNRKCNTKTEESCFAYAIKELIASPSKWEKSKGFTSEIPQGTKLLSVRESNDNIIIDLSLDFEAGGGAESTYARVKQVIKTAKYNTNLPVYLYINGKKAEVIGGEGIMIKQPLSEVSLDE